MIDYKLCRVYNNVLWLCIKNDISIKKMLETVKSDKNIMGNMKRGKNPHISSLIIFCNFFNVSLNELVVNNLCSCVSKEIYESKYLSRKDFCYEKTTKTS